jgi:hypothetical protein
MAEISNNLVFFELDASNSTGTDPGFPEFMLPSRVNDAARALQGALKRWYDRLNPTLVSGGTANAQTLTYSVVPGAYVAGDTYSFIVGGGLTNTGATTLNVNGLGAKNITRAGGALSGGELHAGSVATVSLDATMTNWELWRPIAPAITFANPAAPSSTTSTTALMMGLAGTITPQLSGLIKIFINGNGRNGIALDGYITQIRYGTGSAPANGAALTGSAVGGLITGISPANSADVGFCLIGELSGLTLATAYWIDVSMKSIGGGTASLNNISILAEEVVR